MYKLQTKAQRIASQQAQFKTMLEKGWNQETYKGLEIFTNTTESNGQTRYSLRIFRDNSSNATHNFYYMREDQIAKGIEDAKKSYDMRLEYKEKNPPRKSGAAACASAIREELKNIFPGIKFSVRCQNFSMGDSVDIDWNDGPTTHEVDNVTKKYQYGHFDGMTDMYENSNSRNDIPQAKYVMTQRSMSKELEAILLPKAEEIFNGHSFDCHSAGNLLYQIFCQSSLPANFQNIRIEKTDCTCGNLTDFYKIVFDVQAEPEKPVFEKVQTEPGKVNIIQYSEKAIAVIGDTKPIKDTLKNLGGSFNFRLTCGPGWIFPVSRLNDIQTALTTPANV